jgi:hypothetical protein
MEKEIKLIKCDICDKFYKPLGLAGHFRLAHTEEGKKHIAEMQANRKGKSPWNIGIPLSEEQKNKISISNTGKPSGKCKDPAKEAERKQKISETMKAGGISGGYRKGSGHGKKGRYKGFWCDSTWELAYVLYCEEHSIKIEKNTKGFEYTFLDNRHMYIPDFILSDGSYVEVKGRRNKDQISDKDKAKHLCFPHKLEILTYEEMKHILEYATQKYSNTLESLYE